AVDLGPMLFILPIWALLIGVGLLVRARRRRHWLLLVFPICAALWANLDGFFLLPALAAGILGTEALVKRKGSSAAWAAASAGSVLVCLMNPRQAEIFGHLWTRLFAPDVHTLSTAAALIALAAIPFIAAALPPRIDALMERSPRPIYSALLTLLLVLTTLAVQPIYPGQANMVLAISPLDLREHSPLKGRVLATLPVDCTERLYGTGKELRVFHPPQHTGFLLYRLQTPHPHRGLLDDPELYELAASPSVARGLFQQFEIDAVIAEKASHGELLEALESDRAWYFLSENDELGCFLRR
ncbi:MAG: hypothetical protein ACNA8W_13680, partial [Bradymonadaceae bacterium]